MHARFFHFRRPLNRRPVNMSTCRTVGLSTCRSVDLSTCRPVNLSTCQPVTWLYIEFAFCCGLAGVWGLAPKVFRCESMPIPLNLTYILPYDCPCFVCMRYSFTSVDLSTVDLSTCQPVDMSTCRPVNLSICRPVNMSTCQPVELSTCNMAIYGVCIVLRGSGGLAPQAFR